MREAGREDEIASSDAVDEMSDDQAAASMHSSDVENSNNNPSGKHSYVVCHCVTV